MNFIKTNLTSLCLGLALIGGVGIAIVLFHHPPQNFGQSELQINQGGTATSTGGNTNALELFNGTTLTNYAGYTLTSSLLTIGNATTTNVSVSQSLNIPSGSSQTPTSAGQIAQDTTDDQLKVGDGTAAAVYTQYREILFPISTSTAWAGTSTLPEFFLLEGMTYKTAKCRLQGAGGAYAQITYGPTPTYLPMIYASSSEFTITFTSNNTPGANASTTLAVGNASTTVTSVVCSVKAITTGT